MNFMTPIEICAMLIALSAPLLLALREYIITRQAAKVAAPKSRNCRGWTLIRRYDNAPFAGRALAFISRRALAVPHVRGNSPIVRYSIDDGEFEDSVVAVAKGARALLAPEKAWLKDGWVEDAQGNEVAGGLRPRSMSVLLAGGVRDGGGQSVSRR